MTDDKPKLMGTWDVCKLLWVSIQYIDQLVKEDKILYQRISSWLVFFEEDIIKFSERRKEKGESKNRSKNQVA